MSRKSSVTPGPSLHGVRVEGPRENPRRHTRDHIYTIEKGISPKVSSMSHDCVYVNAAYEGSLTNINERRIPPVQQPPTSVIREQYWACSKWPYGQRILAIAVGVLLGAVVGLAMTMFFVTDRKDSEDMTRILRSHAAPD